MYFPPHFDRKLPGVYWKGHWRILFSEGTKGTQCWPNLLDWMVLGDFSTYVIHSLLIRLSGLAGWCFPLTARGQWPYCRIREVVALIENGEHNAQCEYQPGKDYPAGGHGLKRVDSAFIRISLDHNPQIQCWRHQWTSPVHTQPWREPLLVKEHRLRSSTLQCKLWFASQDSHLTFLKLHGCCRCYLGIHPFTFLITQSPFILYF